MNLTFGMPSILRASWVALLLGLMLASMPALLDAQPSRSLSVALERVAQNLESAYPEGEVRVYLLAAGTEGALPERMVRRVEGNLEAFLPPRFQFRSATTARVTAAIRQELMAWTDPSAAPESVPEALRAAEADVVLATRLIQGVRESSLFLQAIDVRSGEVRARAEAVWSGTTDELEAAVRAAEEAVGVKDWDGALEASALGLDLFPDIQSLNRLRRARRQALVEKNLDAATAAHEAQRYDAALTLLAAAEDLAEARDAGRVRSLKKETLFKYWQYLKRAEESLASRQKAREVVDALWLLTVDDPELRERIKQDRVSLNLEAAEQAEAEGRYEDAEALLEEIFDLTENKEAIRRIRMRVSFAATRAEFDRAMRKADQTREEIDRLKRELGIEQAPVAMTPFNARSELLHRLMEQRVEALRDALRAGENARAFLSTMYDEASAKAFGEGLQRAQDQLLSATVDAKIFDFMLELRRARLLLDEGDFDTSLAILRRLTEPGTSIEVVNLWESENFEATLREILRLIERGDQEDALFWLEFLSQLPVFSAELNETLGRVRDLALALGNSFGSLLSLENRQGYRRAQTTGDEDARLQREIDNLRGRIENDIRELQRNIEQTKGWGIRRRRGQGIGEVAGNQTSDAFSSTLVPGAEKARRIESSVATMRGAFDSRDFARAQQEAWGIAESIQQRAVSDAMQQELVRIATGCARVADLLSRDRKMAAVERLTRLSRPPRTSIRYNEMGVVDINRLQSISTLREHVAEITGQMMRILRSTETSLLRMDSELRQSAASEAQQRENARMIAEARRDEWMQSQMRLRSYLRFLSDFNPSAAQTGQVQEIIDTMHKTFDATDQRYNELLVELGSQRTTGDLDASAQLARLTAQDQERLLNLSRLSGELVLTYRRFPLLERLRSFEAECIYWYGIALLARHESDGSRTDLEEALERFDTALDRDDSSFLLWAGKAATQLALDNQDAALETCNEALSKVDLDLLSREAETYATFARTTAQARALGAPTHERLAESAPDSSAADLNRLRLEAGFANDTLDRRRAVASVLRIRARIYTLLGRADDADRDFSRAAALDPSIDSALDLARRFVRRSSAPRPADVARLLEGIEGAALFSPPSDVAPARVLAVDVLLKHFADDAAQLRRAEELLAAAWNEGWPGDPASDFARREYFRRSSQDSWAPLRAGSAWARIADSFRGLTPPGMIRIPETTFPMGSEDQRNERPVRRVTVTSFAIDAREVSVADYARFLDEVRAGKVGSEILQGVGSAALQPNGWSDQRRTPNAPVRGVSWHAARAYATWAGKMLPTEAQWEAAARGSDARLFPWGEDLTPEMRRDLASRAFVPAAAWDITPDGVHGMALGVREWTRDVYDPNWYRDGLTDGAVDPVNEKTDGPRTIRGGAFDMTRPFNLQSTRRDGLPPETQNASVGFRCVWK
ncbi:MAG: SUMF1/EgtB/PvdO family nonheme iron enzyme [Candidatus Sumerlaeia bacterium]|nr:SUMF1/EgtB/PvdO family nonheme iron enzyme [Candidatus Sumerlaeia bacterium]